jgi:hypothetical protein
MKCFYHADRDAVGVCKSCQRALCRDCVAEVEKGIACKSRCEEDVRQLAQLIDQNARYQPASTFVLSRMRRTRIAAALFYFAMGVGFIAWGVMHPYIRFISLLGVVFIIYGAFTLSQLPKSSVLPRDSNAKT